MFVGHFSPIGTVELAYGTPYLLSLKLSKDMTALVWLAGPLSGKLNTMTYMTWP